MILSSGTLVGLGGALGAVLRFAVDETVDAGRFPTGTLIVNVLGSFVLGILAFGGVGTDTLLFVGTGACGAFTTFSSFSVETVRLVEEGRTGDGVAYAVGTLVAALSAVGLAWILVSP